MERPRTADGAVPIPLFTAKSTPNYCVGDYQVIGELARGGMGTVFLARRVGEAGFRRLFAVKVMHKHLAEDEQFIGMLLDEARLAARIHHHNVVGIVDLGMADAGHYIVMEYIEGCSLSQMLKKGGGAPPSRLVVPLMIDALNGLHAAHNVPDDFGRPMMLVHRDVSPQNILVGLDGVARITDFGIATARSRITSTRPGVHKGKLAYSAPEQLDGTTDIDARVDVFAAGAVLWSLLTGRRLFRGKSDAETLNNLLNRNVPPPSSVNERVPVVFDDICLRALQRDRALRFPSAASMAESLRQAAVGQDCLGGASEIADWVKYSFSDELEARRVVIRQTVHSPSRTPTPMPILPGIGAASTGTNDTFTTQTGFAPDEDDEPSIEIQIGIGSVNNEQGSPRRLGMWAMVLAGATVLGALTAWLLMSPSPSASPLVRPPSRDSVEPPQDESPPVQKSSAKASLVSEPKRLPEQTAPIASEPMPETQVTVATPPIVVTPPRRKAVRRRRPVPRGRAVSRRAPPRTLVKPAVQAAPIKQKRVERDVLSPQLEENPYVRGRQ